MAQKYILALDQGTTSSRSVLVDEKGKIVAIAQEEFEQIYPASGWVEHDPFVILETQLSTLQKVIEIANITSDEIVGIGITNQRETLLFGIKIRENPFIMPLFGKTKGLLKFVKI